MGAKRRRRYAGRASSSSSLPAEDQHRSAAVITPIAAAGGKGRKVEVDPEVVGMASAQRERVRVLVKYGHVGARGRAGLSTPTIPEARYRRGACC